MIIYVNILLEIERLTHQITSLETQLNNTVDSEKMLNRDSKAAREYQSKIERNLDETRLALADATSSLKQVNSSICTKIKINTWYFSGCGSPWASVHIAHYTDITIHLHQTVVRVNQRPVSIQLVPIHYIHSFFTPPTHGLSVPRSDVGHLLITVQYPETSALY